MDYVSILNRFTEYLDENEKSENTIDSYIRDVKQFLSFYTGALGKDDLNHINKQDIKDYTEQLMEYRGRDGEPLAIKTINRKLVSLNQFLGFLIEIYDMKIPPKVKQLKTGTQSFTDDMLDINDVRRIIRAAEREDDVRAVTILYTLFYTGARVSEMLQIKTRDMDKDSVTVKGKGNKYRELLIPKKLKEQWREYMYCRHDNTDYLFSGERGPINRQTVHNIIKFYTGKARGISKSISHAHSFRHLYAQSLAELGVNPVIIAQLLGHSLNVTGLYIQQSKKELLKIINKLELGEKD